MKCDVLRLGKYILLLLLLLCFGWLLSENTEINGYKTPVIYYTDGTGFLSESVKSMREEESGEALSWTAVQTVDNQCFSNEMLNRSSTGTLLLIDGNSSNLVSATGELMADDLNGCILSTQAAWELFGETEVTGGEIICNRNFYEVRGVYEDTESVVLLPAETYYASEASLGEVNDSDSTGTTDRTHGEGDTGTDEAVFDKIILSPGELLTDAQRSEVIDTFETLYGLGDDKTDCLIYRRLAGAFTMLFPALVLICLLVSGIVNLVKIRRRVVRLLIRCAVLAAVTVIFFLLFQIRPKIPADLIPNTWSDFDFWKEKLNEFSTGIQRILFRDKSEIELNYFRPLVRMSAFAGAEIILFILTVMLFGNKRTENNITALRSLFMTLLGTCIVESITIFLLHTWGISLDGKRMLIYLWPYYLAGRYFVSHSSSQFTDS